MAIPAGSGSLVCRACGAAVPVDRRACGYCGAVVVLPSAPGREDAADRRTYCTRCATLYPADAGRCPRCPPASGEDRGGVCPRCAGTLEPTPVGPVTADRCSGCRGHWFDGHELDHALPATTGGVPAAEAARLRAGLPASPVPPETVRYLACVRCGERMARRQAAKGAGVVVDVCTPHGLWLDAGELEHFRAWVAAGGLEVLRRAEVEATEEGRVDAAVQRALAGTPAAGPGASARRSTWWVHVLGSVLGSR